MVAADVTPTRAIGSTRAARSRHWRAQAAALAKPLADGVATSPEALILQQYGGLIGSIAQVTHDTVNYKFVLADANGNEMTFND